VKARPTALIIDDDLNGLVIFGTALRRQGFEVLTAGDGRTGVAVAAHGDADVVVLDLRLPDLSGLEALRLIRRAVRTVPVVMITAYPTTTSVVQAMRLGAVDYLEKPLTENDLFQAVRAALDSTTGHEPDSAAIPARHAAARWADAVARLDDAPEDPRTIRLWGRHIGASPGSWCPRSARSTWRG
jgi:DNA-binding response OmpR family regulator